MACWRSRSEASRPSPRQGLINPTPAAGTCGRWPRYAQTGARLITAGHGPSAFLFDPPRRALVPVAHRVGGPRSTLIGMARSARVRNLILLRHHGSNELESMRVNQGAGRAFGFDCRHVAGDALAARTAILVVRMLFDRGRPWTIR